MLPRGVGMLSRWVGMLPRGVGMLPSWTGRPYPVTFTLFISHFILLSCLQIPTFNPHIAGIDFSLQNLTSVDVRF